MISKLRSKISKAAIVTMVAVVLLFIAVMSIASIFFWLKLFYYVIFKL